MAGQADPQDHREDQGCLGYEKPAPSLHVERLLLSQDVCHTAQLRAFGGNGYTYLQETFLPRLREAGVPEAAITRMTIDNPRRILSIG